MDGKGILRLKDVNGDGKIDDVKSFASCRGTGITIKDDYLYASSNDEVFRAIEKFLRMALQEWKLLCHPARLNADLAV